MFEMLTNQIQKSVDISLSGANRWQQTNNLRFQELALRQLECQQWAQPQQRRAGQSKLEHRYSSPAVSTLTC